MIVTSKRGSIITRRLLDRCSALLFTTTHESRIAVTLGSRTPHELVALPAAPRPVEGADLAAWRKRQGVLGDLPVVLFHKVLLAEDLERAGAATASRPVGRQSIPHPCSPSSASCRHVDVFPTRFAMNTRHELRRLFPSPTWDLAFYCHASEPQYVGNSVATWRVASFIDRWPRRSSLMVLARNKR